jgi:DNA-binding transcriptional MerR regulator
MHDDYTLADLARMAAVTPRTVRYYLAQGLLPSPDAAGPATRYGAGHLARLRLIRRLQRDHLPLAEIRERLEQMTDDEVVSALATLDASPASQASLAPAHLGDGEEATAFVRGLMEEAQVRPRVHRLESLSRAITSPEIEPESGVADVRRVAFLASSLPMPRESSPSPAAPPPANPGALPGSRADERLPARAARTTWERVVITPDVEIHVRRPLKPLDNKRVDLLERHARELFQEDT